MKTKIDNIVYRQLLENIIFSCIDMDIEIEAVEDAKKILFKSNKRKVIK